MEFHLKKFNKESLLKSLQNKEERETIKEHLYRCKDCLNFFEEATISLEESEEINEALKALFQLAEKDLNIIFKNKRKTKANENIHDLIECLKDKDPWIRKEAINTLREIGESAKEAIPNLIQILKDKDLSIRKATAEALVKMGAEKELFQYLNTGDTVIREFANKVFENFIRNINDLNTDTEKKVLLKAIDTSKSALLKTDSVLPFLLKLKNSKDLEIQQKTKAAIQEFGGLRLIDTIINCEYKLTEQKCSTEEKEEESKTLEVAFDLLLEIIPKNHEEFLSIKKELEKLELKERPDCEFDQNIKNKVKRALNIFLEAHSAKFLLDR